MQNCHGGVAKQIGKSCFVFRKDLIQQGNDLSLNICLHGNDGVPSTAQLPQLINVFGMQGTAEILRKRQSQVCSPWIFYDPFRPELPINPGRAYQQLKTLLTEVGLPDIRFHDLRHTFATHALSSGVDAKTLAGILGHTKASFTLDTYTHTTGDMQKRAAEIVGGFLTDYLGEEMKPWQSRENTAPAPSV